MPYNATTGQWTPEDDTVQTQLKGLLSQDSNFMKQAKASGLQTANRRGLLNSSIAAGAAQKAAYDVALPIASQESSQIAAKNLSAQNAVQSKDINADTLSSNERIANMNVQAHDRQYAISAAAEMDKTYQAAFTEIAKLTDISKDARDAYYQHLSALRDSDLNLIEQMYGIDLDWASVTASAA